MAAAQQLANKTVIGFGASVAAVSTMAGTEIRPAFFVDGNPALHGESLAGAPIYHPGHIESWLADNDADDVFVIVFAYATRAVTAIFRQLTKLGLRPNTHFTDCSTLHYEPMAEQLRTAVGIAPDPELFRKSRNLALSSPLDNRSSIAGTWLMQQLLRHQLASGSNNAGDIAEAGVYKGGSAFMTVSMVHDQLGERDYHLLDSFAGLPELADQDPASRAGEFADVSVADVRQLFARFSQVHIHAGLFADTFAAIADRQFCFVYVDCDLYEPAVQCCEFFFPRLTPGGMILFHDYWQDIAELPLPSAAPEPFTGIRLAVDELATRRGLTVVRFPETTHALLVA